MARITEKHSLVVILAKAKCRTRWGIVSYRTSTM